MACARNFYRLVVILACVFVLTIIASTSSPAQTLSVLHAFANGVDGQIPYLGAMDAAGNLYGVTAFGGSSQSNCSDPGCGTVFKLSHKNGAWILSNLYTFTGGNDGVAPHFGPSFGPDGALYGTTMNGGNHNSDCEEGCGIVYKLQPPASVCRSVLCPWNETILHSFGDGTDGSLPSSGINFDRSGKLYGTTLRGGTGSLCGFGCGVVYQLGQSNGHWSENVIYNFAGALDGSEPQDGVVTDAAGNLFGTSFGPTQSGLPGAVYELSPSDSGWSKSFYYVFHGSTNGSYPIGLALDANGNLYGGTELKGAENGGTVYELSPSPSGAGFSLLYSLSTTQPSDPIGVNAPLTIDSAGNLYGTTGNGGQNGMGSVFKLTRGTSSWTYSTLHDFTGADDGAYPVGPVSVDAQGNVFGSATGGGAYGYGVVFVISQ